MVPFLNDHSYLCVLCSKSHVQCFNIDLAFLINYLLHNDNAKLESRVITLVHNQDFEWMRIYK